jgi:hypothetical protein
MSSEKLNLFPDHYTFEHRVVARGEELVVTCSPTRLAAFYGTNFDRDVLYVCDPSGHYFTEEADVVAAALSNFFRQKGYRRIVLIGFSKSGFGAFLLAQLIIQLNPACACSVISFSPQVLVFPRKSELSFPSYKSMIKKSTTNLRLKDGLTRFGKLGPFDDPRVVANAYCGARNAEDVAECAQLSGAYAKVTQLPFASHLSHIPFIVDTTDPEKLGALLDKSYAQNAAIEEAQNARIKQTAFEEMSQMAPVRPLKALVSDEFAALKSVKIAKVQKMPSFVRSGKTALRLLLTDRKRLGAALQKRFSRS